MMYRIYKIMIAASIIVLISVACGNNNHATTDAQGSATNIAVDKFNELIAHDDVLLIDVRTAKEYSEGHIQGAMNIDVKANDFAERTKDIKGIAAVYCLKGVRGMKAATALAKQGCTVYNLDGGITAWKAANLPTVQ